MIGVFMPGRIQKNQRSLIRYFFNFLPEVVDDDIVAIDFYNDNSLKNQLQVLDFIDFPLNSMIRDYGDWSRIAKEMDEFIYDNGFTTMVIYKAEIDQVINRYGEEHKIRISTDRAYEDKHRYFNYQTSAFKVSRSMFIDRCGLSLKLKHFYQYIIDPLEPDYSYAFDLPDYKRLYYTACKRENTILMPYYEYMLSKDSRSSLGEQVTPFTFYGTAASKDRQWLADLQPELESIDGFDVNIATKDREHRSKVETQDDYFDMVSQSKCSMVGIPYDHQAFGWTRFCECLYNNCLPLVWSECSMQDIENAFPETTTIIRSNLLVYSVEDLVRKVDYFCDNEAKRENLIEILKESIYKKHVLDIKWLRKRWQRLPGIRGD